MYMYLSKMVGWPVKASKYIISVPVSLIFIILWYIVCSTAKLMNSLGPIYSTLSQVRSKTRIVDCLQSQYPYIKHGFTIISLLMPQ